MSVTTFNRQASPAEMGAEIDRRGSVIETLEAEIAAMRSNAGYPALAIEELRCHQTQMDMDGVMVGVSRQALDEVLTYYGLAALASSQARMERLEEALRPFANAADDTERLAGHDGPLGQWIDYADLRRARSVLGGE